MQTRASLIGGRQPPQRCLSGLQHGTLKRVSFDDWGGGAPSVFDSRVFAAHIMQLCRCRPDLLLRCTYRACDFQGTLLERMINA